MRLTEIKSWLIFLFLNFLLFLPRYIMEFDTGSFFPPGLSIYDDDLGTRQLFYRRSNYDIFRVSVDLLLLVTMFYMARKKISVTTASWIAGLYYLGILLFLVYFNALSKIFQIKPLLSSDLYLLKLGYYNTGSSKLFLLILLPLALAAMAFLFNRVFRYLFLNLRSIRFSKLSIIIFALIWIFYLQNTIRSGMTMSPEHVVQFSGALLIDNIKLSVEAAKSSTPVDFKNIERQLHYDDYTLREKPNINLIFLESYGNILNRDPHLRKKYEVLVRLNDSLLTKAGWFVTSTLSFSPVSGGKSWLAFTSFLYGVRIDNQGSFLNLLKNREALGYTHFTRYLKQQDYRIYWLNALPNRKEMSIPWRLYTDFYGVDQWILDKDLRYSGKRFGFGPSAPDQYSLFFTRQLIENEHKNPYFMFFISQNSHTPFHSPEKVVSDWQSLNTKPVSALHKPDFLRRPDKDAYMKAIEYALSTLCYFIKTDSTQSTVYIVIGDHQPPMLTKSGTGYETPLHIIARDEKFINSFNAYGFNRGFGTDHCLTPVKHEALYSVILRELIRNYGNEGLPLPDYLPDGFEKSQDDTD